MIITIVVVYALYSLLQELILLIFEISAVTGQIFS